MRPFIRWVKQESVVVARMLSEVPPDVTPGQSSERSFEELVMGGTMKRVKDRETTAAAGGGL